MDLCLILGITMKRTMLGVSLCLIVCVSGGVLFGASFPIEEGKRFTGEDFTFPVDLLQDGAVIVALNIGTSRENGEVQMASLFAWQEELEQSSSSLNSAVLFHLSVIDGAPFFVKGAIRKGLAESYGQAIDLQQGAVVFLSKAEKFAEQAHIPIDGEPTLVVLAPDGTIAGYVKGEVDAQALSRLEALWKAVGQ